MCIAKAQQNVNFLTKQKRPKDEGKAEQIIGREGETATLLSRCVVTFGGLGGGFAPRHLSRYMLA